MLKLLHIEWLKVRSNIAFWFLLVLYMLGVYVLSSIGTAAISFTTTVDDQQAAGLPDFNIYNFPDIWHNLTYVASYLKFFLGIMMIVSISNELQYKTLRQNVIDGLSKLEFVLGKVITAFLFSLMATLFLVGLVFYFGQTYGDDMNSALIMEGIEFLGAFFLQTFTFLCFCMLLGLLIRSIGLAIVLMIAYTFLLEIFVIWIFLDSDGVIASLLPVNALNNLIRFPFSLNPEEPAQQFVAMKDVLICIAWLVLDVALSYLVIYKKDL